VFAQVASAPAESPKLEFLLKLLTFSAVASKVLERHRSYESAGPHFSSAIAVFS